MRDNWALLYAAKAAAKRGVPVAVAFNLVRPAQSQHPNAAASDACSQHSTLQLPLSHPRPFPNQFTP